MAMATLELVRLLRSSIGFDGMPLLLSDALGREEDGYRSYKTDIRRTTLRSVA
jgi:hypothetical protein